MCFFGGDVMPAYWSEDEKDIVLDMWRKGETAVAIAETLGNGRTRNSVLGYLHRLRKEMPDVPKKTEGRPTREKRFHARPKRISRPKVIKVAKEPLPVINAFTPIVEQEAPVEGIPYFETRRFHHCTYILNTSRDAHKIKCCGGTPFRNSSWCRKHYHEVFTERTNRGKPDDHSRFGKVRAGEGSRLRQM